MGQERQGRSRLRVLTAIAIAFDVGALVIAATRNERAHVVGQHEVLRTSFATAPEYSILVIRPNKSAHQNMPCFQPRDAGSNARAALGGPVVWECDESRAKPSATAPGATRVYGVW